MRVLLWFLLIVGIVGVAVLAYFGLPAQSNLAAVGAEMDSAPLASSALFLAALLTWPLAGIFALLIALALFRWLWRALKTAFGHDAVSRLLSGGIAALIFSGTLQSVFSPLITLLFDLFGRIPTSLANVWLTSDLFKRCSEQAAEEFAKSCLHPLFGNMVITGAEALNRFGDRISGLDIALLIVALAVWTLLGQLFSAAMQARDAQGTRSRWADLLASFADRSSPVRANLLLFAIIAVGATLSASALIAIPVISDSVPLSDKEIAQARTEIDALLADEVVAKHLPAASPVEGKLVQSVQALRQEFGKTSVPKTGTPVTPSAPAAAQSAVAAELGPVEPFFSQLERDAEFLEDDTRRFWLELRDSTTRQLGDVKDDAHDLIERQNLAATSLRNKAGYLLDIKNWVAGTVRTTLRQTDLCRSMIEEVGSNFRREARFELSTLRDYPDAARPLRSLTENLRIRADMRAGCTGYFTRGKPDVAALPALGPFSFAAWLIQLSSMSLTLVAGMLGFGLLGAAISSIVSERKAGDTNEPLVTDFGGLVIRGMSATVVVYLAVKGGLAIFTGVSAPEPNAYVLLLTCFVASVFSNDVWVAAKQRLKNALAS